jgi:hypothetical protein
MGISGLAHAAETSVPATTGVSVAAVSGVLSALEFSVEVSAGAGGTSPALHAASERARQVNMIRWNVLFIFMMSLFLYNVPYKIKFANSKFAFGSIASGIEQIQNIWAKRRFFERLFRSY